jgi:hypothetical protein
MNTTSSTQTQPQPVPFTSDETSIVSPTTMISAPLPFSSVLIPRSALVDHRIKCRAAAGAAGLDLDANKLSTTTIKRSQAISNIQDLDEDSPVTFVIGPNEHLHGRKRVQLQLNPISTHYRLNNDSLSSIDKQTTLNNNTGAEESDSRSETSEKLPEYIEEEKPILSGVHVKGATLNRLVRILIDSFRSFVFCFFFNDRFDNEIFFSFRIRWNGDRRQ